MTSPTKYVAYIDEAGDDGLKNVANADGYFGSDWFVLSCVVARYNYTLRFPDLLEEARSSAGYQKQARYLRANLLVHPKWRRNGQ